jgi:hypothetical protein
MYEDESVPCFHTAVMDVAENLQTLLLWFKGQKFITVGILFLYDLCIKMISNCKWKLTRDDKW